MPKDNKAIQSNKQFIVGNGILAFGVFFIVILFLYLSFRSKNKTETPQFAETFSITLDKSLSSDSVAVYVNDSLLFNQMVGEATRLQVRRFSETNMLMVVNQATQEASSFNLDPKALQIRVQKTEQPGYQISAK